MNILNLPPSSIPLLFPNHVFHNGMVTWNLPGLPSEILLPDALLNAARSRQLEYVSGRLCAREALLRLGSSVLDVGFGKDGCPVWPAGIVGSITHSAGLVFSAVARQSEARSLGLDVEKIMPPTIVQETSSLIAKPREFQKLYEQLEDAPLLTTIIFSAKETVFKCLYPILRFRFDFTDAELAEVDCQSGSFTAVLHGSVSNFMPGQSRLTGSLAVIGDTVHTGLILYHL